MPRSETFTLYPGRKEALVASWSGELDKEWRLLSDAVGEDGIRTIRMKPKDLTELAQKRKEVVDAIMVKLEETSKTLRAILLDSIRQYNKTSIDRLYKKVVLGKEPIRKGRGCYYISVGDGRRKDSEVIRIRE